MKARIFTVVAGKQAGGDLKNAKLKV